MTDDATMSLIEHLEELRSRIIVIAIAVAVTGILGFFLAEPILALLRAAAAGWAGQPHPADDRRVAGGPAADRRCTSASRSRCR